MDRAAPGPASRVELDTPVHAWLRSLTRDAHARTEAAAMHALTPARYDRYAGYLQSLLALYAPLEDALWGPTGLASFIPDAADRRKVPWLLEDLATFDRARPPTTSLPLSGPLEQLGAAYVVEGATLGGAVLLARLRDGGLLLDQGRPGARFLSGYGRGTAARWHAFRSALQRAACSHADWTPIGAGALATFRAFEAAITAVAR